MSQNRDELRAEKHPGMHEITPFLFSEPPLSGVASAFEAHFRRLNRNNMVMPLLLQSTGRLRFIYLAR